MITTTVLSAVSEYHCIPRQPALSRRCYRCPTLWAHINFISSSPLDYLDLMLQRSSTTLVNLRLREAHGRDDFGLVLDKVTPQSHWWHLLSVIIRSSASVQLLRTCDSFAGPLPHLKNLLLDQQLKSDSIPWLNGRLAVGAPYLTSLDLTGISFQSCNPAVFNNLTALEIQPLDIPNSFMTYDLLVQMLSSATRLEALCLHCEVKQSSLYPGTLISLLELCSLEVGLQPPEDGCLDNLYTIFHAPKVECLGLISVGGESRRHHQFFVEHVKENGLSCFPALRQLDVDIQSDQDIDQDFFRNLPLITTAAICNFSENAVLRILSKEHQGASPSGLLWPCLKHLAIEHCDMELVCNLVRHRIEVGNPLEDVTVYSGGPHQIGIGTHMLWLEKRVKVLVGDKRCSKRLEDFVDNALLWNIFVGC